MKHSLSLILFSLFIGSFLALQPASAEVPFPESGSVNTEVATETPAANVTNNSLPMDPTLFAALIGIAGMLIGSLITLTGAFAFSKMKSKGCESKEGCCKNKPMDIEPALE